MQSRTESTMSWEEAQALLGVSPNAGEAEIHSAYLERVRLHPPDREPEQFERIRDAYDQLRDPRRRAQQIVLEPDPDAPLVSLLGANRPQRHFVGPKLWLDALKDAKEKRP